MNSIPVPSLQHIACVQIAVQLWTNYDIKNKLAFSAGTGISVIEWVKIEEVVLKKVTELRLPDLLLRKVTNLIIPMGLQLHTLLMSLLGCSVHNSGNHWINDIIENYLYWKPDGKINKQRVIKTLIRNKKLDAEHSFIFACTYCLDNDITCLWNQLSGVSKTKFLYDYTVEWLTSLNEDRLLIYWTNYCDGKLTKLCQTIKSWNPTFSMSSCMVDYAAFTGNDVAVKYFWDKLSEEEKNKNIVKWTVRAMGHATSCYPKLHHVDEFDTIYDCICTVCSTDIMCFFLSLMNEEQQARIYQPYPECLLQCLLSFWPWQDLYGATVIHKCKYLSEDDYLNILSNITLAFEDKVWKGLSPQIHSAYRNNFKDKLTLLLELFGVDETALRQAMKNSKKQNTFMIFV